MKQLGFVLIRIGMALSGYSEVWLTRRWRSGQWSCSESRSI